MSPSKVKFPATLATSAPLRSPTSTSSALPPRSRFQVCLLRFSLHTELTFLGYAGYIQGVKSEVQFGQTYGMTSLSSKANAFHKGRDEPANLKYTTMMKKEFINHADVQHETVAQIVGVERSEPRYARVSFVRVGFKFLMFFVTANSPRLRARLLRMRGPQGG